MGVTPDDVRRIAELAELRIEPGEVEAWAEELNGILEHFEALQRLDVGDAPVFGTRGRAPLRADDPGADPLADGPASIAPDWSSGFFTVPRLASHVDAEGAGPGAPGLSGSAADNEAP